MNQSLPARGGARLSRVVMAYYPENFEKAVADFSRAFGLEFEMMEPDGFGLRIAMAFEAGVEIITPLGDGGYASMTREKLDRKGEGIQQFLLEVADLEEGVAQAKVAGLDNENFRIDCFRANPAWRETYASLMEAPLPDLDNVSVTLIEKVRHGGG